NRYLCERPLGGRFMSLWVGVLTPDGLLTFVDAGHGHWAMARASGEVVGAASALHTGGIPVGIECDAQYTPGSLTIASGDRLVVYSDGIVEQRGQGGKQFGAPRLQAAIRGPGSPGGDVERIFEALA